MARTGRRRRALSRLLTWLFGLAVLVALLGLYLVAIAWAPDHLVDQSVLRDPQARPGDRLTAQHNARFLVISIAGALVILGSLVFTGVTYRLSRRGQLTDRFSHALQQLGSDEPYVRIGGIYALERVMRDSREYHDDAVEVLIAFVRARLPQRRGRPAQQNWLHPPAGEAAFPDKPPEDVQRALTAIARRPRPCPIDLSGLHLNGVQLHRANLRRARLVRADLRGARITWADLRGAVLIDADLRGARLAQADLRNALLMGASMQGAHLGGADLRRAGVNGAILRDADLSGADLRNAWFLSADLRNAQFVSANMRGTWLAGAQLHNAQLRAADLRRTRRYPARPQARFDGTDFTGALTHFTRWPSDYRPASGPSSP